jgi:hypothetical protein
VRFRFTAEVWRHTGEAAWHFLTLPSDVADEIEFLSADQRRGFGSVRVRVRIGSTEWSTSVFPDSARGSYVLPVKASVRRAEDLHDGTSTEVGLDLLDPTG